MATNATSIPLFNTDPNIQAQAALLQQRQAMAKALMEESLKPVDTTNRMAGGVAYRVSPLEGLAKMAQAVGGQKLLQDSTTQQAQLAAQAYAAALQANQPGSGPSYSNDQVVGANQGAIPQTPGGGPPAPRDVAAALMQQGLANQGSVNPRNPLNMPAELLTAYQAGMIPKEVFDAQAALYKPTEATLAARQGGLDPVAANRTKFQQGVTDPKIWALQQAGFSPQQIYAAQYGEAAKAADVERKPKQFFSNAFTGERGITPDIPDNANPVGVPATNGALPGVTPIPGAAPVVQGNAQASSTGNANGSIVFPTTNTGAVVPMRGAQAAPAGMAAAVAAPMGATLAQVDNEIAQTQKGINTVQDPASKAMLQKHLADMQQQRQSMVASTPALGQSTAAKVVAEKAGETVSALPQQVAQTKQTITGLENALAQIQQLQRSGPGMSKAVNALAIVQNIGIPLEKGDVNGYQTLKKYIENAASSAAASGGFTGSDARFEQFKAGQPNAETMSPQALEGALRYVLSQQDAALNQGSYLMNKAGTDPNRVQSAKQEWATQYNPRYFEVQRLDPKAQAAAVQNMKPAEAAAFLAWRKAQRGG